MPDDADVGMSTRVAKRHDAYFDLGVPQAHTLHFETPSKRAWVALAGPISLLLHGFIEVFDHVPHHL